MSGYKRRNSHCLCSDQHSLHQGKSPGVPSQDGKLESKPVEEKLNSRSMEEDLKWKSVED